MLHHRVDGEVFAVPVRSYDSLYNEGGLEHLSLLTRVVATGYRRSETAQVKRTPLAAAGQGGVDSVDFDVASLPPLDLRYTSFTPGSQTYQSIHVRGDDLPPAGWGDANYALVDLFGSGLPDVLELSEQQSRYWRNLGAARWIVRTPCRCTYRSARRTRHRVRRYERQRPRRSAVHGGPLWGFYELQGDAAWRRFVPDQSRPSFLLSDPRIRLVDMTGDGRSDVVRLDANDLVIFPCVGEGGFGDPVRIPRWTISIISLMSISRTIACSWPT